MRELCSSPYFGIALSVLAFGIGVKLNEKLKTPVCNPLVIAIVLIVGVLLIFKIPYEDYNAGGKIINMFLAPATACLAVAIYTKYRYSNSTGFRFLSAARPDLWHLWEVFTDCAGYSDWIKV